MSFYFLFLNYFLWNYYGTYLCRAHRGSFYMHGSIMFRQEKEKQQYTKTWFLHISVIIWHLLLLSHQFHVYISFAQKNKYCSCCSLKQCFKPCQSKEAQVKTFMFFEFIWEVIFTDGVSLETKVNGSCSFFFFFFQSDRLSLQSISRSDEFCQILSWNLFLFF